VPAATVFERIPVGIVMAGRDGRIEYANPYFCELLGLTADELSGIEVGYFRTGPAARMRMRIQRLLRSGASWHGRIGLQTRTHAPRAMYEWCYPLSDEAGRVVHVIHFFHDVGKAKA
jgi:PAS domain S-box-containing protein